MSGRKMLASVVAGALGISVLCTGSGCESHAAEGALIGGAGGAAVGAIIGNNSHGRTAEGALIGGAIGAIGGGLIGNEADKDHRAAYEHGYYEGRNAPPVREEYRPAREHYRDDGYYETYRETRVYRRY
jgi:hypothetical protein